jgi:biotin synthase
MPPPPDRDEIARWVRERDPRRRSGLWEVADGVRQAQVGDEVHLRGLIEISNHCVRHCAYCGINAGHRALARYRLDPATVVVLAQDAREADCGTVVLQAGEDPWWTGERVADLIRRLKVEVGVAVTLSLGERPVEDLARWREAGADRYLLRFETGNQDLYRRVHPPQRDWGRDRRDQLADLRRLGYEVGSGFLVGLPGSTWDDLVDDILLCRELDLDMVGIGPYLPHPMTPLGRTVAPADPEQVPAADVPTTLTSMALLRLLLPTVNLPATTALGILDPVEGLEAGLRAGANIVMPDFTPDTERRLYSIYPGKEGAGPAGAERVASIRRRLIAIGRTVGTGAGTAPVWHRRREGAA